VIKSVTAQNRPELLAPVQDWNTLEEVVDTADAVYFGIQEFNMRQKARNFKHSDLENIVNFCHNSNPPTKAYLTTNILIYDSELQDLEKVIIEAKNAEVDAIIAHDLAAIRFARKNNMKFHISTQANVSNIESAKFYEEIGAQRIILARELSLKQIKLIKHHLSNTEIECFVHGSMCTAVSGRCYFSATVEDSEKFSANRGNCVQPCRREWRVIDDQNHEFIYDGQMFLNAKDLCMIEYIPELIQANIDAFKIEGRMKDSLYVKIVTECYREAIDSYYENSYTESKIKNWLNRLSKVYNRGFHTGFYFHKPTIEDIQLDVRGNASPFKKHYLGQVLSFDPKSMTANILIEIREFTLKLGDEIFIIGEDTQHHQKIKHMVFRGEKIKTIKKKRYDSPFKINMRVNKEVKEKDKIYIIYKT
jgi:putative protease